MIEVEKQLAQSEQYSRQEYVETTGFPTSIPEDKVEEKFVEVLKEVGRRQSDLQKFHLQWYTLRCP